MMSNRRFDAAAIRKDALSYPAGTMRDALTLAAEWVENPQTAPTTLGEGKPSPRIVAALYHDTSKRGTIVTLAVDCVTSATPNA